MKNRNFVFGVICMLVLFFALSCKTEEVTQKASEPQVSTEKRAKKYTLFIEDLRPGLKAGDSLKLCNSFDIQLVRTVTVYHPAITADGALGDKDTTYRVTKTIPAKTPGGVFNVVRNKSGNIIKVTLKHSTKDDSYVVDYFLEDDICYSKAKNDPTVKNPKEFYKTLVQKPGSFILGGMSTLIFKNKEYELKNQTINSNGEKVRLLVEDQRSQQEIPVVEQAEGWNILNENINPQPQTQSQPKEKSEKNTTKSNFTPSDY